MNRVDEKNLLKRELAKVEQKIDEINKKRRPAYTLAQTLKKELNEKQKNAVRELENYLYDELEELYRYRYVLFQKVCDHPIRYENNKGECKCIKCGKVDNSNMINKNIVKDNDLYNNYNDYVNKYHRLEEQGLNEEDIIDNLCTKNKVKTRKR